MIRDDARFGECRIYEASSGTWRQSNLSPTLRLHRDRRTGRFRNLWSSSLNQDGTLYRSSVRAGVAMQREP